MVMTTFEYYALLEKIKEEEEKNINKEQKEKESLSSSFYTWKELGVVYDEWGSPHLGMVEKTGFEGEGT